MNKDTLVKILNSKHNGSFFRVEFVGDASGKISAPAKKAGITSVTKQVVVTARKGIDYDAQKSVKEAVENGKVLTHKLPWGVWSDKADEKDLIIYHNNKSYVRVYFASVPKTQYYINNKPATIAEVKSVLQASYFNNSSPMDCATINTDNITVIDGLTLSPSPTM